MLHLTSLSFAHPAVLSDLRARLTLPENILYDAHGRLRSEGHQTFLMSTCLRVEIAWAAGPEPASEVLACLYGDESLAGKAMVRCDEDAFVHLSRVAAGLDSPLVGEMEVLSQFRRAVSMCQEVGAAAAGLGRVLEAAVGIGRTTRRLLGETTRGSLGVLAAGAAATSSRVAILGAGAMARAAAEQLDGVDVTVFARRSGNIAGRETVAWDQAPDALATFPVVISTVPGSIPLFTDEVVARAFDSRNEPLLLIDLGMPPGFAPTTVGGAVRYFGVDEVASLVKVPSPVEAEERIVRGAAAVWRRLSAPERVGEVIAGMMEQAETAVSEEVQRFANRLAGAADPQLVLRQLAHSVARRVLHPPISFVSSTDRGVDAVEILAEAFGIDDD